MRAIPTYFKLVAPPRIGGVDHPKYGEITFRGIDLKLAAQLWKEGFAFIRITPAGAQELFGELELSAQVALLKHCRDAAEANAIGSLSHSRHMQEAVAARMAELFPVPVAQAVSHEPRATSHEPVEAQGSKLEAEPQPAEKAAKKKKAAPRART